MKNIFVRAANLYKRRGMRGVLEKLHVVERKDDILLNYNFITDTKRIPYNKQQADILLQSGKTVVNWVIPEMGPGSGGHTTIFRMASFLEKFGLHNRIYLFCSPSFRDDTKNVRVRSFTKEHFPILDQRIEVFSDVEQMEYAQATIATSWETAYFVRRCDNTESKFYFVQDFEPYFFAAGSQYQFAENTYKFGLRGITAGDWLRDIMRNEYGMTADSFHFSCDRSIYKAAERSDDARRVFFYARPVTARRDFELGLLALDRLTKKNPDIEVIFAGWDISDFAIPFKYQDWGIVTPQKLAEAYASCDMCLVISNTNLSLVPFEVMSCNSVAVCSKGENSSWQLNDEIAILVDYDPIQIADTMDYYFAHPAELSAIREKGFAYAKTTSWETEAHKVYDAVMKGIEEDSKK